MLFNMSVWEPIEALNHYVYRSEHVGPLRDRRQWFEPLDGPSLVLWWIPAGHLPTIEEGKEHLRILAAEGPTTQAFTFTVWFPPPGEEVAAAPKPEFETCEWTT